MAFVVPGQQIREGLYPEDIQRFVNELAPQRKKGGTVEIVSWSRRPFETPPLSYSCNDQDKLRAQLAERAIRPGKVIQCPSITFKNSTATSKKEVFQSNSGSPDWAIVFIGEKTVPSELGSEMQKALVFRGLRVTNSPCQSVSSESKLDVDLANVSLKLARKGAPALILVVLSAASKANDEKIYSKVKMLGDVQLGKLLFFDDEIEAFDSSKQVCTQSV